mmetsp:Transcript_9095/g.23784  ORF Transcript_9095/g.23784 Transcript_9095/m.23784 type:complete len:266 (-) Transcript_9095:32-829(-)
MPSRRPTRLRVRVGLPHARTTRALGALALAAAVFFAVLVPLGATTTWLCPISWSEGTWGSAAASPAMAGNPAGGRLARPQDQEARPGRGPGRPQRTARNAVIDPPTATRPPDVAPDVTAKKAEWVECLINDPTLVASRGIHKVETWVLRRADYDDFLRMLKLRGFQNVGQQASLKCRERQVDAELRCAECVRLLRGGTYGNLGVSVPAYPPQGEAVGCLALSRLIDMPAPRTEEDDSGDWDGDQGRQAAFCNSVNARFENVEANA